MRELIKKTYHKHRNKNLEKGFFVSHPNSSNMLKKLWQQNFILFAIALLIFSVLSQAMLPIIASRSAELTAEMYSLTGESRDDTTEYLKPNENGGGYNFSLPENNDQETSEHTGRVEDAYSANLPGDAKEGITVTEKNSKISVTLIPGFNTQNGQKVDGDHVVYPSGPDKLVYTLKYNGLKEDIIVPKFRRNELSYKFTLRLPAGVEAKLDERGNIGIYSSDTTLFGDISYGSDEDRAKVELARQNGQKNNLVMTIPYPIVKDSTGTEYDNLAEFTLSNQKQVKKTEVSEGLPEDAPPSLTTLNQYTLTITANQLDTLTYPISIDPTMQVNGANSFEGVQPETGVVLDTANSLIKRSPLTGGILNTWDNGVQTAIPSPRWLPAAATYGSYIYLTGGNNGANLNQVYVTKVNSSGTLVSPNTSGCGGAVWCTTSSFTNGRVEHGALVNNGYLYILGGNSGGGYQDVQYAKIKADGSLGTFASTSSMTQIRSVFGYVTYGQYLYAIGGWNDTIRLSSVERALVNADGTLGAWSTAGLASINAATRRVATIEYNGYFYSLGGNGHASSPTRVEVAKVNADGTISSWQLLNSYSNGRARGFGLSVASGYLYIFGGCNDENCSARISSTEYAQINSDGTIGSWSATTSHGNTYAMGFATVNQKIFSIAGCFDTTTACTNIIAGVRTVTIKPAGWTSAWAEDGDTFTTGRARHATVAYNGYLYIAGGCTNSNCSAANSADHTNTVYKTQISSDGTVGAWSAVTSFTNARENLAMAAYNGRLYLSGGWSRDIGGSVVFRNDVQYATITASTGALSSWTTDGDTLQFGRGRHTMEIHNGYLYVIAGYHSGSSASVNVERSTIASDGTIGSFSSMTDIPSGQGRNNFASVIVNDRLFIMGGCQNNSCDTLLSNIYYTDIDSSGNLSSWSLESDTSLSSARWGFSAVESKGNIYVVGGCTSSGSLQCTSIINNTEMVKVNSGNTLDSFASLPGLSTARYTLNSVVYNGYVYATGGCSAVSGNCTNYENTVEAAQINNGGSGTANTWSSTSSMITARTSHRVAAVNGYIYAIGGCTDGNICASVTASVEKAQIQSDGTLSAWTTSGVTALPNNHRSMAMSVKGDKIYITGGCNQACSSTVVYYATVATNGDVSSWTSQTGFTAARREHQSVVVGDFLYVLGGVGASLFTDVQVTRLNSDGSITSPNLGGCGGATWCATTSLPTGMRNFSAAAAGGYIYTFGGCVDASDCNGNITKQVYSTVVNSDGSLGSWALRGNTLYLAHSRSAVISNGYVYILGGFPNTNINVEYAPILAGGGVGNFSPTTNPALLNSINATASNGNLYSIGGNTGSSSTQVNRTSLNSIPRTGSFTRRYDFDAGVKPTKLITRGTQTPGANISVSTADSAACGATAYDAAVTTNNIGYNGANALNVDIGSTQSLAKCLTVRYTIDDTLSAVFPDSGKESTITDFDLYFIANPGKRLRGGRTFINGTDRGLDAQPQ